MEENEEMRVVWVYMGDFGKKRKEKRNADANAHERSCDRKRPGVAIGKSGVHWKWMVLGK